MPKVMEISVLDDEFRKMDFSQIDIEYLLENPQLYDMDTGELVLTSIYNNLELSEDITWDKKYIWELRNNLVKVNPNFNKMSQNVKQLINEMEYFPVAASTRNIPFVEYVDSWFFERTYGGTRKHEGCDIMAKINKRGIYPVVSVCDGIVEQMGWLEKGGYRVGVRSDFGIYYYYAHLSEYSTIKIGDRVAAGDLLGFMGDTGYSKVEGTTGMFDVHLHFGIYLTDDEGNEVSVNPYWILKLKKNKVLYFDYGI